MDSVSAFYSCVTLGTVLNLSEPCFLYLSLPHRVVRIEGTFVKHYA